MFSTKMLIPTKLKFFYHFPILTIIKGC